MNRIFIICLISCMLFSCTKSEESGNNNNETPVKPKDKITLDIKRLDIDAYSDPITLEFNATSDWKAIAANAGSDKWIKVEPESGAAGNAKITINFAANNWYEEREGDITIISGNTSEKVVIKQGNITSMLTPIDGTYESSDYSKDGEIHTMLEAKEGNGIDIVFMGDGFADTRINDGSYHKTMMYAMEMFFNIEPYKSFRHLFNCKYVNVISKHENFDNQDTALQTYFGEGTAVSGHTGIILKHAYDIVGKERLDETTIIVVVNSPTHDGMCVLIAPEVENNYGGGAAIAWNALDQIWTTIPHECGGHGFGKLADEYVTYNETIPNNNVQSEELHYRPRGWYKNIDYTDDPNEVKWSHFLSDSRYKDEDIGIFEGANYYQYGAYRPSYNSMMSNSYSTNIPFNAPSREAIYYRIHKLAYGEEWEYDYEKFVEYDAINRTGNKTRSQQIDCVTKPEKHSTPIILNKTWREVMTK